MRAFEFDKEGYEEYNKKTGLSTRRAYFSLLKSMINTGILYQPRSFFLGGLVYSSIVCVIVGYLTLVCMMWLSKAHDKYGGTYGEIAGLAMGKKGLYLLDTIIFITQFGPGAINIGFIIDLAQKSLSIFSLTTSSFTLAVIIFFILTPICQIKSIKDQFWIHVAADIIILSSILTIGIYSSLYSSVSNLNTIESKYMIYTLGTLVYGFEGIPLLLPIKETMKKPLEFKKIIIIMIVTVVVVFLWFCSVCNLAYGQSLKDLVILNLPEEAWVAVLLFAYSCAVMFTMPLVLNPVFTISEKYLGISGNWVSFNRVCFILCVVVAGTTAKDYLGIFVSFIGGVFSSPLAFIFPAVINLELNARNHSQKVLSVAMIITGIFFGIAASISTIYFYI